MKRHPGNTREHSPESRVSKPNVCAPFNIQSDTRDGMAFCAWRVSRGSAFIALRHFSASQLVNTV